LVMPSIVPPTAADTALGASKLLLCIQRLSQTRAVAW
jgi:hypothetical protein